MRCPACSNELRQVRRKSAVIDVCAHCQGMWFDHGEFVLFVQTLSESENVSAEMPRLFEKREVETADSIEDKNRVCPKCSAGMKTFNYATDSNVFIDKCPNCKGIWTDAGEAAKIAGYLKVDPKVREIGTYLVKQQRTADELEEAIMSGTGLTKRVSPYRPSFLPPVLPISDDGPREKKPVVTASIVALCAAAFLLQFLSPDIDIFYQSLGFFPGRFFHISLLTSLFLHAGIGHLSGNMLFL
ncbi:MAG: zf-TFIIB domain-containing protein, partial [Planctomycetota bacterium]